ncbi:MAG TPA: membrane-bound lytic murein transglycosylase MltF [Ignavibacteriaceae bacterium]|nr:membrane-bound lytic murein transglycosylase MltF [Ignavibacteriaceae bacterium]
MKNKKIIILISCIIGFIILYLLFVPGLPESLKQLKKQISKNKKLTVFIRNSPSVYYEGVDGPTGFEYDLVNALADSLDMELDLKVYYNVNDVLDEIKNGEGDLASAAITITDDRENEYVFSDPYQTVQQQVIYKRGHDFPEDLADLGNFQILVGANSSYDQRLKVLKEEFPGLSWETTDELSTEQILEKVWKGEIECTVADNNLFAINQRYFPGLESALPISEEQSLAWVINDENKVLQQYVNLWLEKFESEKQLAIIRDRYYGHINIFDFVDIRAFHKRVETRLPKYKGLFKKAGKKNGIPWKLLAAQAYQESHWDPKAKSRTGVRGIMMLTENTARSLGISNRLDPVESIMGGARYLKSLERIVPDDFIEEDRIIYSLAAYNVGMGHMKDARVLAKKLGYDEMSWKGLKKALPLLSNEKYYKTLQYGYARGTEPVRYINRIQNYTEILEQKL